MGLGRAMAALGVAALVVVAPAARADVTAGRATAVQRTTGLVGPSALPLKGVRRLPHAAPPPLRAAPASVARPSAEAPAPSASVLANFDGVSSRDSAVTNFGLEFEPPDQGLCVGNGFVVETVNSAYTVYRPTEPR